MVIVFDVNGTLTDIRALGGSFRHIFGDRYTARHWFTEVVEYSMALTLAGRFEDFGEIAGAVLAMAAKGRGVRLSHGAIEDVRHAMQSLPPFPDVKAGLKRLRTAGFRLGALSNSAPEALEKQLSNAGLDGYFDRILSTARVRRFKPAPEVYRSAARSFGVPPRDVLMVAAHPWDLLGAARAGCRTALIRRPIVAPFPGAPAPDLAADDLEELAGQILGEPVAAVFHPLPLAAALAVGGIAAAMLLSGEPRRRPMGAGSDRRPAPDLSSAARGHRPSAGSD